MVVVDASEVVNCSVVVDASDVPVVCHVDETSVVDEPFELVQISEAVVGDSELVECRVVLPCDSLPFSAKTTATKH